MIPFDWSYKSLTAHPRVDEICCTLAHSIVSSIDQARSYTSETLPIDRDFYELAVDHLKKNFLLFDTLNGSLHHYEFSITSDNRIQVDVTPQGYVSISRKRSHVLEVQPMKVRHRDVLEVGDLHTQDDFDQARSIFSDRLPGYDFDFDDLSPFHRTAESKFKSFTKQGYTHYLFCCRLDGEIVGALYAKSYLALGTSSRNTMELCVLSVKKGFDGKQIGSTLLSEVKLLAEQTGCVSLELESIYTALPFYKKYGFRMRDIPSIGELNQSDQALITRIQKMDPGSLDKIGDLFIKYAIDTKVRTSPNNLTNIGRFIFKLANKVVEGDQRMKVYYERLIKLFLNCLRDGGVDSPSKKFRRIKVCKPLFSHIFKSLHGVNPLDLDLWNLYQHVVNRYCSHDEIKLSQRLINFAVSFYCPNIQINDSWSRKDLIDYASKLENLNIQISLLELPLTLNLS